LKRTYNIETVGYTEDGTYKIKFTDSKFSNIIFTIGGISIEERDEQAILHYEYFLDDESGPLLSEDEKEFKKLVGDYILESITRGIENNDIIYKGGVDED
jgi:hypothetical protein